jgi:ADP-ribose pyrophosphatase
MPKDQAASMPILESEVGFAGRIWNVKREKFDFNGEPLVREYVDHPGAVAIVALNERMEVLLIKQYRHPVGAYLWEIPAGLKDVEGESELDAAQRELFEETGWVATAWEDLTSFYTTPGGNSEEITIYLARELSYLGHKLELEGEEKDLEVAWVPLQDAVESVLKSDMKSPSAVVGILALGLWVASGALR